MCDIVLEKLLNLAELMRKNMSNELEDNEHDELPMLYGEVKDVVERFVGIQQVAVSPGGGAREVVYPNLIEAGHLSARTFHTYEGYQQILQVIGQYKQSLSSPRRTISTPSIEETLMCLGRFRECCQYRKDVPSSERDVQEIIWIMLRSQHDRVEREETLPKVGSKAYRPDFGLPDLRLLVEVKFLGQSTKVAKMQDELLADSVGYFQETDEYDSMVVVVYDAAHELRDATSFVNGLRKVDNIIDVIVVPGMSRP
jgi:hypothetical protein